MDEALIEGGRLPLDSLADYRMGLDRFWDGLEMELDSLPPQLCRQSQLLRQNLGIRHSPTGTFRDILRGPDANPVLHQHSWMLEDLIVPKGPPRHVIEEGLFRAAVYTVAHLEIDEEARSGDHVVNFENLRVWLVRQTSEELAAVLPGDSDFWPRYRRRWESYGEANLAMADPAYGSTAADLWTAQTARSGPLAHGPLAVAAGDRSRDLEQVERLLDHLGFVELVRADLAGMMRHLARGWLSPTVRRMVSQLGIDLGELPVVEVIIGEIVLKRARQPIDEVCLSHLQEVDRLADTLRLPTFGSYGKSLAATITASRVGPLVPSGKSSRPFTPGEEILDSSPSARPTPLEMAVGYLFADPTFREAWEVHRWGLLGAAEISARFPAGLILEILAQHGREETEMIDDFFWSTEDRHLAYYDHPAARPYIETDTLGLLLRLYKHSSQTERHRTIIGDFLHLLHQHARPDRPLPVWLVERDQAPAVILGEGCGTIEANLLRGLLDYRPNDHVSLVMPSVRRLLEDYAARGASINVNYPQSYARAVIAELMEQIQVHGMSGEIPGWEAACQRLRTELARTVQHAHITPQDAACLIWTCSRPSLANTYQGSWQEIVTSSQSFDGGWAAEPFFFAPTSGGRTMWYSSRLLTTALCFRALALGVDSPIPVSGG